MSSKKEKLIKILTDVTSVLIVLYLALFHVLSISQMVNYGCLVFMFLICLLTFLKGESFAIPKEFFFLIAFYAFAVLSLLWSPDPSVGYRLCFRTIPLLTILALLLYNFIRQNKNPEILIYSVYVTGIVMAIAMVVSYGGVSQVLDYMRNGYRLGGIVNNENDVGMALAMAAIVALFLFFNKRYWHIVPAFVFAVFAMATGSRKVIIILLLGGILSFFSLLDFSKGNRLRNICIVIGALSFIAICIIILFSVPAFVGIKSRILTMINSLSGSSGGDGSTDTRMKMIEVGWEAFKSHPIKGVGIGTSSLLGFDTYLHNNFIEILASLGLVGFLLYYATFAMSFYRIVPLFRLHDRFAFLAVVINICWLAVQIGCVVYETKDTYYYLVLMSVLSGIFREDSRTLEQTERKRSLFFVD